MNSSPSPPPSFALPLSFSVVKVTKDNRELCKARILEGRSVLHELLDLDSLENEKSPDKLFCAVVELAFLAKITAGTVYAANVEAVLTVFEARLADARVKKREKAKRAFEERVKAKGGGLLARYVLGWGEMA